MRYSLAVTFAVTVILTGCSSSRRSIQDIASEVHRYVPAGWSISTSNNMIRISSDYEVALIGRISRPAIMSIEDLATTFGRKTKYEMTLTFIPLLSTNQYLNLKAKRAPFLYTLDHGARTDGSVDGKTLYDQAMTGYATHRVPTFFTQDYSIFVDRPIDGFEETYPSNALVQADATLIGLKNLFRQYED